MVQDYFLKATRRDFVAMLSLGTAAVRAFADAEPALHFSAVDHVSLAVSDTGRSVAFYSRIFGNTVMKDKRSDRRYLQLGPAYMAISSPEQGQAAHRVDHICGGVEGYQTEAVRKLLQTRGVTSRDGAAGLMVSDPDGLQIQLFESESWNQLPSRAAPESVHAEDPIFRPTGLDHLLLRVSDPDKAAEFYAKIFGPVTQRANNRTWFQVGKSRIGLIASDAEHPTGVDHFCVAAERFGYETAVKQLQQAGAKVQAPEVAGAPEFRDPDGILVQVMAPRAAA
ncbi:MAG TPA: VOC family protein [Bryobacteraceae bacterium]|nr:VOC family protein [Bryobacteraceae bacterium]